jgi:predicted membrane chloride channel (bestrophin family)
MAKDRANIFTNRYEDTENPGQGFWKMMLVWHGSVFKLIWLHLLVFIVAFSTLNLLYKHVFMHDDEQREIFEVICIYCSRYENSNQIFCGFV